MTASMFDLEHMSMCYFVSLYDFKYSGIDNFISINFPNIQALEWCAGLKHTVGLKRELLPLLKPSLT